MLLSISAFKFKLRRYNSATTELFYFCHIHKFMVGAV
jgi:hypothetical protein